MGPKYNSDSERKIPQEEEVESMDWRFHEERDEKYEFRNFFKNMLKFLQDISTNIIKSSQETREFLSKQLEVKDGEGRSIGSQCEERKVMGGDIFSKTGPYNRPLEYKDEPKLQPRPTMPKFVETPKEDHEAHAETIATWEEKFFVYQSLSECRRALSFRDLCENEFRGNPIRPEGIHIIIMN